jgi:glycosyltransferase involved in cell wall biosynthesis
MHKSEGRIQVSVVIAVWNGESTLARAIDSALNQAFDGPFEVVVVDDGSTDGTARLLESYHGKAKIVSRDRQGTPAARNAAVRASQGEYVAFLDADDVWLPDKLSKTMTLLVNEPSCVLAYSDLYQVDATGKVIKTSYVPEQMAHPPSMEEMLAAYAWPILPSATVMHRSTFDACGGFCEEFRKGYGAEDNYLWLCAREHGPFLYLPERLVLYRARILAENFEKRLAYRWPDHQRRLDPQLIEAYVSGDETFARLVDKRYGPRAEQLVRLVRREQVSTLTFLALLAMSKGERMKAREILRFALRYNEFPWKTRVRLLCTFVPFEVAEVLSTVLPSKIARNLWGPPLIA